MALQTYKDLVVWQTSRAIAKDVYSLCSNLPKDEMYGLSSQMKRAAISIPSNIAEGYRRNNRKEYLQFLGIAAGSAAELETQLILTGNIYGINTSTVQSKLDEVQKMLTILIRKLDPKP